MAVGTESSAVVLTDLLFNEPSIGRCLVAPDGSVLRANAEWLRSTGLSSDEVVGVDIVELFPNARDMVLAMHARARAGHRVEVPRHALTLNGRETWWEGSIAPVPMDGGTGLLITACEVTSRLSASAEVERVAEEARLNALRMKALISALPVGVIVTDAGGRITFANAAAQDLVGGVTGDASGPTARYTLHRLDGSPFPQHELPLMRALHGDAVRSVEMIARRADGTERVLLSAGVPVRVEGAVTGAIAVMQDITDRKREEAALRASEERFRLLADTMPQIVCVLSPDGTVEFVNKTWTAYSGLDPAATTRAGWEHAVHPEDLGAARECRRRVLKRLGPQDLELRYRAADGTFRWFLSRLAPMVEGGRVVRLIGAAMEIEGRKRAEAALARSEAAFSHASKLANFGAWSVEYAPDGAPRSVHWSDEVYRIHGCAPGETEVSVPSWIEHIHPDDRARVAEAIERSLHSPEPFVIEHRVIRRDGTERVVVAHGEARFDSAGRPTEMIGALQDVTEQKRIEQELRDSDRRKSEFLAVLSHELRNPLAPIRNSIYLLARAPAHSEQALRAKEVIRRQSEQLTHLVDDLLDITRISRGKIELRRSRIDLREVVWKTTDDLHSLFMQAGVELRLDVTFGPVWVDGDATRLSQVLANLLQNAVKFTPSGGSVTVGVATKGHSAELCVRDTGSGMEPGTVERMFEPFVQAGQSLARAQGGLGLGLALVKGIVELHGGRVEGRSGGIGRGAEFLVFLPLTEAAAETRRERDAGPRAIRRTILVIEDNLDAAQSLAEILEFNGDSVRIARDARTGIALAHEMKPDVVLSDIGLPDLDGYEVARELRRDETLRATRLVALSGYAQPEDRQRAYEAGFDAHIAKPPNVDELMNVLAGESNEAGGAG